MQISQPKATQKYYFYHQITPQAFFILLGSLLFIPFPILFILFQPFVGLKIGRETNNQAERIL